MSLTFQEGNPSKVFFIYCFDGMSLLKQGKWASPSRIGWVSNADDILKFLKSTYKPGRLEGPNEHGAYWSKSVDDIAPDKYEFIPGDRPSVGGPLNEHGAYWPLEVDPVDPVKEGE